MIQSYKNQVNNILCQNRTKPRNKTSNQRVKSRQKGLKSVEQRQKQGHKKRKKNCRGSKIKMREKYCLNNFKQSPYPIIYPYKHTLCSQPSVSSFYVPFWYSLDRSFISSSQALTKSSKAWSRSMKNSTIWINQTSSLIAFRVVRAPLFKAPSF